jgi:hypothetical protein
MKQERLARVVAGTNNLQCRLTVVRCRRHRRRNREHLRSQNSELRNARRVVAHVLRGPPLLSSRHSHVSSHWAATTPRHPDPGRCRRLAHGAKHIQLLSSGFPHNLSLQRRPSLSATACNWFIRVCASALSNADATVVAADPGAPSSPPRSAQPTHANSSILCAATVLPREPPIHHQQKVKKHPPSCEQSQFRPFPRAVF